MSLLEKLLEKYDNRPDIQNKILGYHAEWKSAKQIFASQFNNESKIKFRVGRGHLGSYLAFGAATYNTYRLRQQIIKKAIMLTKSKNPMIIKFVTANLAVLAWAGLSLVWHVPSISIELAFHYYNGLYAAFVSLLMPQEKLIKVLVDKQFLENNDLARIVDTKKKS